LKWTQVFAAWPLGERVLSQSLKLGSDQMSAAESNTTQLENRSSLPVAIAGGGIGGLACALALARHGYACQVYEQAKAFGEVGVGLQVAPNALAVLKALGVDEALREVLPITGLMLMDAVTGEKVTYVDGDKEFQSRFGNPYVVAHRADIHGALCRACNANPLIELHTNRLVTDFAITDQGVSIILSGGEQAKAAALVGADGINSRVRPRVVTEPDPTKDAGVIYRALIPVAKMPEQERQTFITIWTGPGWHFIYYPIRDCSAYNFAVVVSDPSLVERGAGPASVNEVLQLLTPQPPILHALLAAAGGLQRYVVRYRDPIERWTSGPVTLLGDAAHPMVHYLAQGAAMALEDAICLGKAVADADGDFISAFQQYEKQRITRSARVQISALMLDEILHPRGAKRLVRNAIFEFRDAGHIMIDLSGFMMRCPM
jgi:2-polyprenyl-6-methoxyphenol hydroxylase-like FAD-dependent oxidoreductase